MLISHPLRKGAVRYGAFSFAGLLVVLTAALYLPFLGNPPFFDDENFFKAPDSTLEQGFVFATRWLPYWSLGLTWQLFGAEPAAFRLGNLALHVGSVLALFFLLRRLLRLARPGAEACLPAFAGALLFALHPLAVFAVGYIIQRTILMATLFSLLTWWALLRGSVAARPGWLYASVPFFLLAVYAKEHAVTALAGCVVLLVWLLRSRDAEGRTFATFTRHHAAVFLLYAGVAALAVASHLGILAAPYEPSVSYLLIELPFPEHLAYPHSVLTQTGLFFKYLLLWLVPNAAWVSIDMREPIATGWFPYAWFALAMLGYLLVSVRLLWQGGETGLWGLLLVLPCLLFATEFATVRIQEPFVLYRSYLWMPLSLGLAFALFVSRLAPRIAGAFTATVAITFAAFAANQLYTFSQPLFVWDQAARLIEKRSGLLGTDRIYHNRGQAFYDLGMHDRALSDYNKAIEIAPILPYTYNNRGALLYDMRRYEEALADFNRAIAISRGRAGNPLMGRGLVYLAMGRPNEALADFRSACAVGFARACENAEKLLDAAGRSVHRQKGGTG